MQYTDETYVAKTLFGLEEVLAKELRSMGAKNVTNLNRAVSFVGDLGFLYKANYKLRTALRILRPIANFNIHSAAELTKHSENIEWEKFIHKEGTFAITASGHLPFFNHSGYAAQLVKDGIVDRFRRLYGIRPSVDKDNPDVRIDFYMSKHGCTISLDSSGDSLHKRGYRKVAGLAPMSEVLAAGVLQLAGYDGSRNLVDPMCGSGTIPIEAALIADRIPPGIFRKRFGFEGWADYDEELHRMIENSVLKGVTQSHPMIVGMDKDAVMLHKAEQNVVSASLEDRVDLNCMNFIGSTKPSEYGMLVFNPPYDQRLKSSNIEFYKAIGDTLKKGYSNWDAWFITSDLESLKHLGLKITRRIELYNGDLECRLVKVSLYDGSKKDQH